jgi:hypothetical protein
MKVRRILSFAILISLTRLNTSAALPEESTLEPEMIGEGIISTPQDEFGGSISPDGNTIYFDRSLPPHYLYTMWRSDKINGKWSNPQLLPFTGEYRDSDPVLSPDGHTLLFVSDRPVNGVDRHYFDIWISRWDGQGWSEPVNPGAPLNGPHSEYFASMAANGNIYFTIAPDDNNPEIDIFVSRLIAGKYTPPEKLGPNINGKGIVNIEAFVSPDEKFLLIGAFSRPDSFGSSDIYVSYNRADGWTTPVNLGPLVNTSAREYSPRLTPDGKRLLFTSERGMGTEQREKPWTMPEFERKSRSVLNGYGNIYSVPIDVLPKATQ